MSDTAPGETPAAPPDAEPSSKSARQAVLDALLDTVEAGPQTRQQLLDAIPEVDPNAIDQALHRMTESGDVIRPARGTYALAPPKPKPPEPPGPSVGGRTFEEWLAILEAWYANPSSWDVSVLGPRPDDPKNRVPGMVLMMYRRRLDAREKAAEEAAEKAAQEAEAQRTAAAINDVELRTKLLDATHGNFHRRARYSRHQPDRGGVKDDSAGARAVDDTRKLRSTIISEKSAPAVVARSGALAGDRRVVLQERVGSGDGCKMLEDCAREARTAR